MSEYRVIEGDCLCALATLDSGSVQTCITSPPYYGLRDYGHAEQIGLEPTPDQYVAGLVDVFREVRRVLRDDGTLWLNLGDSYVANGRYDDAYEAKREHPALNGGARELAKVGSGPRKGIRGQGYKPKDLLGIPWMVAFALRADGWYLRSDIIWAKPNPMPESVTDRPTKAHEYLFLLSKSARYYYDADAVREAHAESTIADAREPYSRPSNGNLGAVEVGHPLPLNPAGRNKRSVWTVATQPYPGAHFATFPPKLIEPCVLAGSSQQTCAECGTPWQRIVERTGADNATNERIEHDGVPGLDPRSSHDRVRSLDGKNYQHARRGTDAFESSCDHDAGTGRSVVLDPFNGAGTTGMVALRHDRNYIGVEINPEYAQMARDRIYDDGPLLNVEAA